MEKVVGKARKEVSLNAVFLDSKWEKKKGKRPGGPEAK